LAGEITENGHEQLALYSLADAGSLTTAALLSAAARATSLARPSPRLDPSTMSDAALAAWRRAPSAEARPRNASNGSETEDSDGRWLWIAVLALLALETWLRRERRAALQQNLAHDRAA
jgi:hypothetical protein